MIEVLFPHAAQERNVIGLTPGYGMVDIVRTGMRATTVYNPALWDAVRAEHKTNRQKRFLKKLLRKG